MNQVETNKEEEIKSRQQLNKLSDEPLRLRKGQNKQNSDWAIEDKNQFLSTRLTMAVKPLFAGKVTQLVDDYHPNHPNKEDKLERRADQRIADASSDLFKSPFHGLFSNRMPVYRDFHLPNAEELARTPRLSSSKAGNPSENSFLCEECGNPMENPLRLVAKTPPRWIEALATLSPDQVCLCDLKPQLL